LPGGASNYTDMIADPIESVNPKFPHFSVLHNWISTLDNQMRSL